MSTEQQNEKQTEEQVENVSEQVQSGLADVLREHKNAPTQEQIERWKVEHGEIFVSGFSDDDLYVWRPVSRAEWRGLQAKTQNPEANLDQFGFEELVCETAILWKSNPKSLASKGGTASTLYEQILQNSNFMTPQAASMLVARL